MKTYSELSKLKSYAERLEYLKLLGLVGCATFGDDRHLNQTFYKSPQWQQVRRAVILRDNGCDLGIDGLYVDTKRGVVHHMNPITMEDIYERNPEIFNPEYLVFCDLETHNAIHYGDVSKRLETPITRSANDTSPWRK